MAVVGVGCEYEECKCVVLSFFGGISDGFEMMNLFGINFGWEDWEEKKRLHMKTHIFVELET